MALTSDSDLNDAIDQFKDNLRWWVSETAATNLLEAIYFLLAMRPQTVASALGPVTYEGLGALKDKVEAHVLGTATTSQRASFVRGRCLNV